MKPLSARERLLITTLPAVLLLLVYLFWFARPLNREIDELRRRVGVMEERTPAPRQQAQVLSDLRGMERKVAEIRSRQQGMSTRFEEMQEFWTDPEADARAGALVGQLLAENDVVLIEESRAEAKDSGRFRFLTDALPQAEIWRLRIAGSYGSVRDTLRAIGETDLPLLPAGLDMEPVSRPGQTVHLWNLWIAR